MEYRITNENLILSLGGHAQPGLGSQRHLPIFKGDDGNEYVSLNGQNLTPVVNLDSKNTRRESVQRG